MSTEITTSVEFITPEIARKMLDSTTIKNRTIKSSLYHALVEAFLTGNFAANGESIIIARDGSVIDGQHRLMACCESKVGFSTVVVRGVEESTRYTIDCGCPRTGGDTLAFQGFENTTILASIINGVHNWVPTGRPLMGGVYSKMSPNMMANAAKNEPLFVWCTSLAVTAPKGAIFSRKSIGCAAFMIAKAADTESLLEFITPTFNMTSKPNTPSHLLQCILFGAAGTYGGRNGVRTFSDGCEFIVRAWNHHVTGEGKNRLTINRSSDFPKVLGLDGNPRDYSDLYQFT